MAAMTARYEGTCRNCGGRTRPGDKINWVSRGVVEHTVCPLVPDVIEEPRFTFSRSEHHGGWVVRAQDPDDAQGFEGDAVEVVLRSGGMKSVKLGRMITSISHTDAYYAIAEDEEREELGPGVYELEDGAVYIVKPTRDKARMYAKRLVEINSSRLTESDDVVQIEFEYEAGAIRRIKPEHKMSLERAKALTIRYGRCIVCGRHLKAAESVERGIGPQCMKSFGGAR